MRIATDIGRFAATGNEDHGSIASEYPLLATSTTRSPDSSSSPRVAASAASAGTAFADERLPRLLGRDRPRQRGRYPLQALGAIARTADVGDVAGDDGGAGDLAPLAADGRDRERDVDDAAVLSEPLGLVVLDVLPVEDAAQDPLLLAGAIGRDQDPDRPSDHLVLAVEIEALRAGIPARDDAVAVLAEDRVVRRVDDRLGVACRRRLRRACGPAAQPSRAEATAASAESRSGWDARRSSNPVMSSIRSTLDPGVTTSALGVPDSSSPSRAATNAWIPAESTKLELA